MAVMRKWGWVCTDGLWFLPMTWGRPTCRVLRQTETGETIEVEEGFTATEAWTLHRNFHGFFGKEFLAHIKGRRYR